LSSSPLVSVLDIANVNSFIDVDFSCVLKIPCTNYDHFVAMNGGRKGAAHVGDWAELAALC
jgi:hypothetical protein